MILSMKDWGIIMDIMVVINQMIQLFLIIGLGYVTFVTYDMKIRGIYTEVPGLATFYAKKENIK